MGGYHILSHHITKETGGRIVVGCTSLAKCCPAVLVNTYFHDGIGLVDENWLLMEAVTDYLLGLRRP